MAAVTLKNIGGLDLAIHDREFVVLAGPAGCGGSTIVRLIAGLADVSQGDILLDTLPINDVLPKNRDVALLSHDYMPYPGMTVSKIWRLGWSAGNSRPLKSRNASRPLPKRSAFRTNCPRSRNRFPPSSDDSWVSLAQWCASRRCISLTNHSRISSRPLRVVGGPRSPNCAYGLLRRSFMRRAI